jgi:hypothetical protein
MFIKAVDTTSSSQVGVSSISDFHGIKQHDTGLPLSRENKIPDISPSFSRQLCNYKRKTVSTNQYKHLKREKIGCANYDSRDMPIITHCCAIEAR